MQENALRLENVTKRYGTMTAVDNLTLTVPSGIVFGLLGPNGAGKTTTLEIVEGLRRPDVGHVWWGDVDVAQRPERARSRFGVQLQTSAFFELLTVRETLELFHSFYRRRLPVPELISRLDLEEKQNARVDGLSGGQRQRLALAVALINDPEVVFLDEPSAGLDPQARRKLWEVILGLKAEGRTVVLTTHYMEEAEFLVDRLAIIDRGRVLDEGTPRELIQRHMPAAVVEVSRSVGVNSTVDLPAVRRMEERDEVTMLVSDRLEDTLVGLVNWAQREGRTITGLTTRNATLEDVFLELTGRS
ncbi:ABC transporter ATP-binding protein [Sulfobacillus harzensis]|uniref:ABC transporter ATP-binding protein n=1 Tax=Sulfobacillus harzensis TaxID=2729629 RepID=A0A7Y0L3U6_9FIRM|nr:ABC transporter ATP-binding protein [Sulfobacillus harzensis]NMP22797.1 ABC transporter ATP-binding protein [Sulfobacillus harzensis]